MSRTFELIGMEMSPYTKMTPEELQLELLRVNEEYEGLPSSGTTLDMSRGKPSSIQLDLSTDMLSILESADDCFSEDGTDCRNYGVLPGIGEARRLMADMLDDSPETTIVIGSSSLTAMHDAVCRCMDFGCLGSIPWAFLPEVKFLCPSPGYDRHFTICEQLGIQMVPVNMTDVGPDMDAVERLVRKDAAIKGIWCVPKYSNPTGVTYSDEVVERLASMQCAADDFRIFWDNAYCVHGIYPESFNTVHLMDIGRACRDAGTENRYFKFASTSKVTFPGAGICGFAASESNISEALRLLGAQMIGADKLTQLRHARFLPDHDALISHMMEMGQVMLPKFVAVESILDEGLKGLGIARWTTPLGGYFISFDGLPNTAKRCVQLADDAGVKMTGAGATWPYGKDPNDSNIRIAPSMPPLEELEAAMRIFVVCAKKAALEALLA